MTSTGFRISSTPFRFAGFQQRSFRTESSLFVLIIFVVALESRPVA